MMDSSALVLEEKRIIRERMRPRLKEVPLHERRELSRKAAVCLLNQQQFRKAEVILGYLPLQDEVDLFPAFEWAWAAGKSLAFPRYVPEAQNYCAAIADRSIRSVMRGAFGVVEPMVDAPTVPLNRLDFVLVPGLAFDHSGTRLGRGKGFYDRLLAEVNTGTCVKCGVALDLQMVDRLPRDVHDIAMNFILTPTRWLAPSAEQ